MRMIKLVIIVALAGLVGGACRPASEVGQPPVGPREGEQASSAQQEVLREVLDYVKQSGSTLEALMEEVQRRETLERVPGGIEVLGTDVRVAKALVGAARRAATAKGVEKTTAALSRLQPALVNLRSQIPAALITQHLERALVAISTSSAEEAVNLASGYLLKAVDVAMQSPARIVPDVMQDIERAKSSVDKNNLGKGANEILAVLDKLAGHDSIEIVEKAIGEAAAAQQAVGREAWPVISAELDQLDRLLAKLQEKIEEETTTVTVEEAPAAGAEEAGAEPAAAATEETAGRAAPEVVRTPTKGLPATEE